MFGVFFFRPISQYIKQAPISRASSIIVHVLASIRPFGSFRFNESINLQNTIINQQVDKWLSIFGHLIDLFGIISLAFTCLRVIEAHGQIILTHTCTNSTTVQSLNTLWSVDVVIVAERKKKEQSGQRCRNHRVVQFLEYFHNVLTGLSFKMH